MMLSALCVITVCLGVLALYVRYRTLARKRKRRKLRQELRSTSIAMTTRDPGANQPLTSGNIHDRFMVINSEYISAEVQQLISSLPVGMLCNISANINQTNQN